MSDHLPIYLSHSYRREDRRLNMFFFELLNKEKLILKVDPKTTMLSVPRLEMMMARSAGFVGVVTRRSEESVDKCSRYIAFEHGLAIQAKAPRLVFLETGVSEASFTSSLY